MLGRTLQGQGGACGQAGDGRCVAFVPADSHGSGMVGGGQATGGWLGRQAAQGSWAHGGMGENGLYVQGTGEEEKCCTVEDGVGKGSRRQWGGGE
jgi:hypothetical protein